MDVPIEQQIKKEPATNQIHERKSKFEDWFEHEIQQYQNISTHCALRPAEKQRILGTFRQQVFARINKDNPAYIERIRLNKQNSRLRSSMKPIELTFHPGHLIQLDHIQHFQNLIQKQLSNFPLAQHKLLERYKECLFLSKIPPPTHFFDNDDDIDDNNTTNSFTSEITTATTQSSRIQYARKCKTKKDYADEAAFDDSTFEEYDDEYGGIGLKTKVFLKAATCIMEYIGPKVRSQQQEEKLVLNGNTMLFRPYVDKNVWTNGDHELNIARRMNHECHCRASCYIFVQDLKRGNYRLLVYTNRDIPPGGKLTFDYGIRYDELLDGDNPHLEWLKTWPKCHDVSTTGGTHPIKNK